jgi:polyketide cyclase/dehydrase/lipid transport protein
MNGHKVLLVITVIAGTCSANAALALAQTSVTKGERMTAETLEFRHVSVSIDRPPQDVYDFIADGNNLAQWATGLGTQFERDGDEWIAQGPLGRARVRIAKPNDLGVADQTVTLESGLTAHNPIRVVPNGNGSTVTFTLLRQPGVSEQKFNSDANWVQKDLNALKMILEKR